MGEDVTGSRDILYVFVDVYVFLLSKIPYSNKCHFDANFDIKAEIDKLLKGDDFILKPNTDGRSGWIFEKTFSNPIGTNPRGRLINTLKVVINEFGEVVTAFPKR